MSETIRALVPRDSGDKSYRAGLEELSVDDLPAGDVLVDVEYSDLNYKDGLAVTGRGKIVRTLPLVPGIGPALSLRIVEFRERHGPFHRVEDVLKVRGIGEKSFQKIKPYLKVSKRS